MYVDVFITYLGKHKHNSVGAHEILHKVLKTFHIILVRYFCWHEATILVVFTSRLYLTMFSLFRNLILFVHKGWSAKWIPLFTEEELIPGLLIKYWATLAPPFCVLLDWSLESFYLLNLLNFVPSVVALFHGLGAVVCDFGFIWDTLGDALQCARSLGSMAGSP